MLIPFFLCLITMLIILFCIVNALDRNAKATEIALLSTFLLMMGWLSLEFADRAFGLTQASGLG